MGIYTQRSKDWRSGDPWLSGQPMQPTAVHRTRRCHHIWIGGTARNTIKSIWFLLEKHCKLPNENPIGNYIHHIGNVWTQYHTVFWEKPYSIGKNRDVSPHISAAQNVSWSVHVDVWRTSEAKSYWKYIYWKYIGLGSSTFMLPEHYLQVDRVYLGSPDVVAVLDHGKKQTFIIKKEGLPDTGKSLGFTCWGPWKFLDWKTHKKIKIPSLI